MIEPQLKISCGFREIPLHNYVVHAKYQIQSRGKCESEKFPLQGKV